MSPSRDEWASFLAARPIAVIATVSEDGSPHAAPVEVVLRDGKVYVWCEAGSVKARNAARTKRAALTAYKGHPGVLVRGPLRLIAKGEPGYDEITREFLSKYDREETYGNDLLIEITPERVSAWS